MQHARGFTMIEMAIVLGIVGLIAAGILVGRGMMESAQMRAISMEIGVYNTAFKEFVDKYQAVPGDMNNAETMWGSDSTCPTTATNTTPKTATCNGNASGTIGDWAQNDVQTAGSEYEWFRAWQHLANAALIEGKYTGVHAGSAKLSNIGVNIPASRSGKGGWMLMWMTSNGSDTNFFNSAVASHMLIYGGQTASWFADAPIISPANTKSIDDKMDDGIPFTGKIRVKKNTATTCTVSSATTSNYLVASTEQACQLIFLMGM